MSICVRRVFAFCVGWLVVCNCLCVAPVWGPAAVYFLQGHPQPLLNLCLFTSLASFFFLSFFFISWRLITLQYCSGFWHTLKWISHGFTCVHWHLIMSHPKCPSFSETHFRVTFVSQAWLKCFWTPWGLKPGLLVLYQEPAFVCWTPSSVMTHSESGPDWFWRGVCVCVCVCMLSRVQLFCDPVDCSPPVSFVYGIFQARILEWVAISFSRGSSRPRDWTCVSCSGRWRLYQRHQGSPSSEGEWAVNDKTTLSLLRYLQPPKHPSWFTVSLRG